MYSDKKIKKIYCVSLMALAIGLGAISITPAQALLPAGTPGATVGPKIPAQPTAAKTADEVGLLGADNSIPTPGSGLITPDGGKPAGAPASNAAPTVGSPSAGNATPAKNGGLPTISQDNPLFVKGPQPKAIAAPSAPQKEEDILSAVDNELFNQMSDIEKQTALLTLELRREKIRAEIDAMKAQRRKALEEEKDLDAERENKRLAMEKELEQKIIQEQTKLRKIELAYEKLRQERVLNAYKEHMLKESQKWIDTNQKIYNDIATQKKEQEEWTKKYKDKLQSIHQLSQSVLRDAQNKMENYKKEVSDLQAQVSILKARLETQQRPNPFGGNAEGGAVGGAGMSAGAAGAANGNILGAAVSTVNLNDLYVIMEIMGQGDNVNAKLLNRDGQTFMVKKGTKLKSGDVVEEIAPTYLKADRNGEKSYLYFAAGGILDTEPDFGDITEQMQADEKNKNKKVEANPRGLISSRGIPGVTRDMMLR